MATAVGRIRQEGHADQLSRHEQWAAACRIVAAHASRPQDWLACSQQAVAEICAAGSDATDGQLAGARSAMPVRAELTRTMRLGISRVKNSAAATPPWPSSTPNTAAPLGSCKTAK